MPKKKLGLWMLNSKLTWNWPFKLPLSAVCLQVAEESSPKAACVCLYPVVQREMQPDPTALLYPTRTSSGAQRVEP